MSSGWCCVPASITTLCWNRGRSLQPTRTRRSSVWRSCVRSHWMLCSRNSKNTPMPKVRACVWFNKHLSVSSSRPLVSITGISKSLPGHRKWLSEIIISNCRLLFFFLIFDKSFLKIFSPRLTASQSWVQFCCYFVSVVPLLTRGAWTVLHMMWHLRKSTAHNKCIIHSLNKLQ